LAAARRGRILGTEGHGSGDRWTGWKESGLVGADVGGAALQRRQQWIAGWLFAVAAMVFAMVVLGGVTRLREAGLSIVEWKPVTGIIPPLSADAWAEAFASYQQYPEYQKINQGMTLGEFKEIYWLEYLHRLWGRLIGVAFFVPFLIFLVRGWIRGRLAAQCGGLFLLGGLQGALGWYMVQSGLVDRPDVSQYRLVAHLLLALIVYAAILWIGYGQLPSVQARARTGRPAWPPLIIAGLVLLTITWGGFVAGTDAGFAYNTFPLMDGEFIPRALFAGPTLLLSFFEDITTVQFTHRMLAYATVAAVLAYRLALLAAPPPARPARIAVTALTTWVLIQAALGVATVLLIVPLPLAAAHQAGAVVLWTLALWVAFEMRQPAQARPALDLAVAQRP
jgi:cytochrome c oxidase assembly protein subunit 15